VDLRRGAGVSGRRPSLANGDVLREKPLECRLRSVSLTIVAKVSRLIGVDKQPDTQCKPRFG